ncbi:hypothetical protein Tco_0285285 [Tanacetum coccineum]
MDPYEKAALQAPEQAPPSPDYVHGPEYPEYLTPSDDEIPDPKEDPKEDPADYTAADDDEEEKSFEDEEEEEHLAPADSTQPVPDFVSSFEEAEPFETDESGATPPPPRSTTDYHHFSQTGS